MIIVVGTPAEDPVRRVLEEAARIDVPALLLAETDAASWNLWVEATGGRVRARLDQPDRSVDLDEATGLYLRLTAPRQNHQRPDPLRRQRHDAALALVCGWAEVAQLRVANRPSAMASNSSKPYQTALIRQVGFSVPETIVTNDPDQVRTFHRRHSRLIYKSTSGVRSIVHELTPGRAATLERVRNLPTQFQQLLTGTNVRVHVIGRRTFACEIAAETLDYRYREGGLGARMQPVDLPTDVATRCLELAGALDLPLAGIDLLRDADSEWWCFEVNPSPAYSCFEEPTGLPMAEALACWLAQRNPA
jgi:glutathione synthase/RimK-type ligase-like ATP-grasp enzyme